MPFPISRRVVSFLFFSFYSLFPGQYVDERRSIGLPAASISYHLIAQHKTKEKKKMVVMTHIYRSVVYGCRKKKKKRLWTSSVVSSFSWSAAARRNVIVPTSWSMPICRQLCCATKVYHRTTTTSTSSTTTDTTTSLRRRWSEWAKLWHAAMYPADGAEGAEGAQRIIKTRFDCCCQWKLYQQLPQTRFFSFCCWMLLLFALCCASNLINRETFVIYLRLLSSLATYKSRLRHVYRLVFWNCGSTVSRRCRRLFWRKSRENRMMECCRRRDVSPLLLAPTDPDAGGPLIVAHQHRRRTKWHNFATAFLSFWSNNDK